MPLSSLEPSPADLAACRALMRGGSRSFHAASRLLPGRVCDAATSLYAFCRVADDAIDHSDDRPAAIDALRRRLRLAYAATPANHPADRALAHVVHTHAIPFALPEALLDGFAWDAESRRYESLDDLTAYAVRVAGTVGAMMSLLMGTRDPHAVARAVDLGVAMQFSNIVRDIGEDARAGRLYLPLSWLSGAGLDATRFMTDPQPSPALAAVVRRLLAEADRLYVRAGSGIAALPSSCRPAIRAARHLYAEIGREAERRGCDCITGRAVVSLPRKLALVPRAFRSLPAAALAAPPLPQADFLLAAIGQWRAQQHTRAARIPWVIDLFTKLEARTKLLPPAGSRLIP